MTPWLQRLLAAALAAALLYQLHALAGGMGFSLDLLGRALERNAGEAESLPAGIVEGRKLVDQRRLGALRLSPSLVSDPLLNQRAIEAFYPVRVTDDAPVMLAQGGDGAFAGCVELSHSASMGLYECSAKK